MSTRNRPNNYTNDIDRVFDELSLLRFVGPQTYLPITVPLKFASKQLQTQHLLADLVPRYIVRRRCVNLQTSYAKGLRLVTGSVEGEVQGARYFDLLRVLEDFQRQSFTKAARRWATETRKTPSNSLLTFEASHVPDSAFSSLFFGRAYQHHFRINAIQTEACDEQKSSHRVNVQASLGFFGAPSEMPQAVADLRRECFIDLDPSMVEIRLSA